MLSEEWATFIAHVGEQWSAFLARAGIDGQAWWDFFGDTALSVATLVFGFVFLLYLSITFLLWRMGASWTKAQLREYIFLSLVGGLYVAQVSVVVIAGLGYPAMRILRVPHDTQMTVQYYLTLNYASVSSVVAVLFVVILLLVWEAAMAARPRLRHIIVYTLDIWWADAWERNEMRARFCKLAEDPNTTRVQIQAQLEEMRAYDESELLLVKLAAGPLLRERFGMSDATCDGRDPYSGSQAELPPPSRKSHSSTARSRVQEGFHRFGIAFGTALGLGAAAVVIVSGDIAWAIGIGLVLFLIIYGISRVLGWIIDGFFSGGR